MSDELNLDELERLEQAATPGEWSVEGPFPSVAICVRNGEDDPDVGHIGLDPICQMSTSILGVRGVNQVSVVNHPDARFIAAIRNAAPALIAKAREAEQMQARLSTFTARWHKPHIRINVPRGDDPWNSEECRIVDVSLSEAGFVIDCEAITEMYGQRDDLLAACKARVEDLGENPSGKRFAVKVENEIKSFHYTEGEAHMQITAMRERAIRRADAT